VAVKNIAVSDHAQVTASLDLEKPEDRSFKVHTGAEMVFEGTYALRFGYDRDNISFGAGLMFKRLQLDYAYKLLDYIENSHRFSLTFMIGPSASERAHVAQPVQTRKPVLDERQLMVLQLKDRGDDFFHQFQFDSALVYYSQALGFEPGHPEILNTIAAIERARQTELDQQERLRTAEEELRQFIRRYYDQASRFYDRKYYPAALDLLELILEIDSDHENAITLKQEIEAAKTADISLLIEQARTAEQQGKIVEAIEAYNRILDLDAGNDEIQLARQRALASLDLSQQLSLGINLFTQGRYEEARLRFNSVLRVNGDDPVALEYLGRIESAQAEASTLEALQRDRHFWNLYLDGIRHMRNNDYQKAIEAWEQVLQAYPNNVNTLNNLEQARLRLQSEQTR
jgi:tetratricopeptide (TPR) repeat protein